MQFEFMAGAIILVLLPLMGLVLPIILLSRCA